MTNRIFVLRHGETQYNAEKMLQGHCNSPLTAKGKAQALGVGLALKEHLNGKNVRVYSSSLGRALQTAHIVCREIGYPNSRIVEEPRLIEFSLGDWEQRTILRIPVKLATHSARMLPPGPGKAATHSERSDAGVCFTLCRWC